MLAHPLSWRSGSSSIIVPLLRISLKTPPIKKKAWRQIEGTGGKGHVCFFLRKNQTKGKRILDASRVTHRVKDEELAYYLSWHIVIL